MREFIPLGVFIIFVGLFILVIGLFLQAKTDTKFFAGGIIGFIPFGFANDKKLFYIGLGLTIALFLFFLWYSRFLR